MQNRPNEAFRSGGRLFCLQPAQHCIAEVLPLDILAKLTRFGVSARGRGMGKGAHLFRRSAALVQLLPLFKKSLLHLVKNGDHKVIGDLIVPAVAKLADFLKRPPRGAEIVLAALAPGVSLRQAFAAVNTGT